MDEIGQVSAVTFEGPGPFDLPPAQHATAAAHSNNGVTAILFCSIGAAAGATHGKEPEPIGVQMPSSVARELAAQLIGAAAEADRLQR